MVTNASCAIILDFDGTVAVGDGPVWAFAQHIGQHLTTAAKDQVHDALIGFFSGRRIGDAADGYQVVTATARNYVKADQIEAAYQASREQVHTGQASVELPDGLLDFLDTIAAERILVTNAPARGVEAVLERTGLATRIDQLHCSAGKPTGLTALLNQLEKTRPGTAFCGVGDIHPNDLQPVLAAGGVAAYIDRFDHRAGPAHLRAATFEALYPSLLSWAEDPLAFLATYQPVHT